jgi:hypothetical protein
MTDQRMTPYEREEWESKPKGKKKRTVFEIIDHYISEFEATLKQPETWDDTERRFSLQMKINMLKMLKLDIELEETETVS